MKETRNSLNGTPKKEWFKKWILPFAFVLTLLLHLLAVYFQGGFFHWDEHFQILEFVSFKLQLQDNYVLAWEYHVKARSWIQAFFYFYIYKSLNLFGLKDPFIIEWFFRFLSVVLFHLGLWRLYHYLSKEYPISKYKVELFLLTCFFWIYPFLAARISSEMVGASIFFIGLPGFLEGWKKNLLWKVFLNGLLLVLACWIRFTLGFFIVGVLLYLLVYAFDLRKVLVFSLSGLIIGVAGVLIDYWGYGEWVFSPWIYVDHNILRGVAQNFGTSPWWAYFYMAHKQLHVPIGIIYIFSTLYFWGNHFKSPITWGSFLFFLLHMMTSHKEYRFLFPLAFFLPYFFFYFIEGITLEKRRFYLYFKRGFLPLFLVYNFVGTAVCATRLRNQDISFLKFLRDNKIHQIYNFSNHTLKWIDKYSFIKQSFYGSIPLKEIFVKNFPSTKTNSTNSSFIVGGSSFLHYSLFQRRGCQEIYPRFSNWHSHLDRLKKRKRFYFLFECAEDEKPY